jgi:serine/threonine-protein kinase
MPDVEGRKVGAAKDALAAVGLKADVTQKYSESVADGVVISAKPKAGAIIDSGSRVALVVSKGPPPVVVPNLVDMPRDKAVSTLQGLGLRANVVEGDFSPLNRVISQDPPAGSKIPKGSSVTIRII